MLLDDSFDSLWKCIEFSLLGKVCQKKRIIWKARAPENGLNKLASTLLVDSVRTMFSGSRNIKSK